MISSSQVFLDANAIVYALDQTSDKFNQTVAIIQRLIDEGVTLCTSHHVIEEVLHVVIKINKTVSASQVVDEINKIPDLTLIEPSAQIDFAKKYALLSDKYQLGINDALILELMLDSGINRLLSFDKKMIRQAQTLGIEQVLG